MQQLGQIELPGSIATVADSEPVHVVAVPHPFATAPTIDTVATSRDTLQEILERTQPDEYLRRYAVICINDYRIPEDKWHVVRPKPGTLVTIRVVPMGGGGGGKSPLRTLLTIAVMAASFAYGGALMGAMGFGQSVSIFGTTIASSTIGSAIINTVGMLLVNAIAPIRPPKLKALSGTVSPSESPTLFINGARNQSNLFGCIPVVLGKHRQTPFYGAKPFTEIVGNDQYLRMVFVWGHGPLLIEDLKIGETPIENYADVQVVNRSGFQTDGPLTICTNDVEEDNLSVVLKQSAGGSVRNTALNADEISIDLVFAQGLTQFDDAGNRGKTSVSVDIEYALVGSSTWKGLGTVFASSRSSPAMLAESTTNTTQTTTRNSVYDDGLYNRYTTSQASINATTPKRYDAVVLDKFSGDIEIIKGTAVLGTATPAKPSIPSTKYPIAYVYRDTTATIVSGNITDARPSDFITAGYFAPTANGTNTITVGSGTISSARRTFTNATSEAARYNARIDVPRGQYQVRITRVTPDATSTSLFNEITWATLRTITHTPPFDATGLATTELLIKATDQLNGVVDELNGVVTSILPDYDSGTDTWVLQPTQNPASLFRAVLQGPGNGKPLPDSRINLDKLKYWHTRNAAQGLKFNMIRDFTASVYDTLADIAAVAYAAPQQLDGKWTVIIDEEPTLPKQHFTPKNSYNASFERSYPIRPHAWRIRFVDETNGYDVKGERIVYDDGYSAANATLFEPLDFPGVTNPDQVYQLGRRRIAEARLRPEKYVFNADFESLTCTRGDYVLLTHDIISVGLASGRIKQVLTNVGGDAIGVVIDEAVDMEFSVNYGISIRTVSNIRTYAAIQPAPGSGVTTLYFVTAIPAVDAPDIGDLYGFGEVGKETLDVLIKDIKPTSDLAAEITAVPLARPIYAASSGPIPEFKPIISTAAGQVTPFIVGIRSDESALQQLPSGMFVPQIIITLGRSSYTANSDSEYVEVQYRLSDSDTWQSIVVPRKDTLEILITGVEQGAIYEIRARYRSGNNTNTFTAPYIHTVVGMSTPPPDCYDVVIEGDFLRWKALKPRDFAGFAVRSSINPLTPWEAAIPMHVGLTAESSFDLTNVAKGQRTFFVKMVDVAGNESVTAALLTRDFGDVIIDNIVEQINYASLSFAGTYTGASIVSSQLQANDTTLYLPEDTAIYLTDTAALYLPNQYARIVYETSEILIESGYAALYPSSLSVDADIDGDYVVYYKTGQDTLYLGDDADLYLPTSGDSYLPVPYGEYRLFPAYIDVDPNQGYVFKVVVPGGQSQGVIRQFTAIFDVPDEKETFNNLSILAAGTRIPIVKTYRNIKVVNMTLLSGGTARTVEVVDYDSILGPLVQAFDATHTPTNATISATIEGVKG